MARKIIPQDRFQGISYSEKEGPRSSYLFGRSVDYRTDPTKIKILPRTVKLSGTVVTDLVMDHARYSTDTYFYGNTGHIYKRDASNTWTDMRSVDESCGNGMEYFGEDYYLYYSGDKVLGRYGPINGTSTFADDFLGAEGGVPLNTHSLDLEATSSQYATAADSASLSITSDLTLEIYVKHESLPAAAAQMVMVSKWDLNSDERSYKFDLAAVSAVFGDGGDGALTIAANTTQAPTDSACTGTAATSSLTATNAAFATGDKILIHQSRGTGAGKWERNEIASYTAGTITTANALTNSYTSGAQVIVLPEYTNVTVNSGKTWTAKAWNGTVGGILCFLASGTVTVTGTISANGSTPATTSGATPANGGGFRGGKTTQATNSYGTQGESPTGTGSASASANGSGGGGGGGNAGYNAGGGGGHSASGTAGSNSEGTNGAGGGTSGSADLTTMVFGSGGGGATGTAASGMNSGGNGGGAIFFYGATTTVTGTITSNGGGGTFPGRRITGGGGAGGSILIKAQTATLGAGLITATGGVITTGEPQKGGNGAAGRIHLDYYTSYTGTTSPALDVTQDDNLVSSTVYQLRLSVSTDGTAANSETLAKTLPADPIISVAQWYRYAVTWDASEKTAEFFVAGESIGTATGAKTSIYDSTALLALGASFDGSGDDENHLDGKIDDIRIFNDIRTDSELLSNKDVHIGEVQGLQAYYKVNNALTDSSSNSNTLTLVNAPVYDATDVPFSSPTTRRDLDQSLDTTGQLYTLTTAINEGATHRQSFVPAKDPQKSIEVNIDTIGTGDWTLTVHDGLNRLITSATVATAQLNTGDYEFIFSSVWRPIIGATYHFHLTSTVADGKVVTTTTVDLETADFHTYYQFLVEDAYHPIYHFSDKLCIGNERYLATWNAITWNPMALELPTGYRIRCLGSWKEYLAIGTWRGTSMTDYDKGTIFFWDGSSDTYNFYVDVPQGGINAMVSGNPLYFVAGYSGDFMKFDGGKPWKIRRFPKVTTSTTLEIYPHAMNMYRALVHIGLSGTSTDTTIERGVYAWGSLHEQIPESLSYDYPVSTGTTTAADLEIGLVTPIGSELFISWKDGSAYGVDSVSITNSPYPDATCEFLITDASKIWAEKQAQFVRAYFKALSSGDSMKLKYKIDRESSWIEDAAITTANEVEARLPLPAKGSRFNEFQVAVDMATTNSTSPEFYGFGADIDDLQRERRT